MAVTLLYRNLRQQNDLSRGVKVEPLNVQLHRGRWIDRDRALPR